MIKNINVGIMKNFRVVIFIILLIAALGLVILGLYNEYNNSSRGNGDYDNVHEAVENTKETVNTQLDQFDSSDYDNLSDTYDTIAKACGNMSYAIIQEKIDQYNLNYKLPRIVDSCSSIVTDLSLVLRNYYNNYPEEHLMAIFLTEDQIEKSRSAETIMQLHLDTLDGDRDSFNQNADDYLDLDKEQSTSLIAFIFEQIGDSFYIIYATVIITIGAEYLESYLQKRRLQNKSAVS